jgi:HK97 family phage major capsid protein
MASTVAEGLHAEVLRLHHEVEQLAYHAADEHRDFTPDEQAQWTDLHRRLDDNDGRLKQILADEKRAAETQASFDALNSRPQNAMMTPGNVLEGFAAEARSFVTGGQFDPKTGQRKTLEVPALNSRIMQKLSTGRPMTPTEVRVLTDGYVGNVPNTSGGIVPIDFYDQLLSYLIEVSGVMQTGPTVLNTVGGEPIQIPIVNQHTGLTSATQVTVSASQGGTLPSADPIFAQKTLTANKFGIMIQVSRELIDDSGVNLLGYLAMSAGRALGNFLGNELVNGGSGISGNILAAPVAITGGVGVSGTSAAPDTTGQVEGGPSYANLVDMEYSVIAPYRQSRSCYWLAADKTLGILRKLTDTVGRPIWEPSTVLGAPDLLLGKPLVADPFMPAVAATNKSIVFGDFSQYFIRMVGGVRFERSDDFAFSTDLVSFRAIIRADGNLMNPPSYAPQPLAVFQGGAS